MTKEEIEIALTKIGKDRQWLAAETGYTYQTLTNRLAPNANELSFAMEAKIKQALEPYISNGKKQIDPVNDLIMRPTYDQLKRWNKVALAEGKILEDWAFDELEEAANEYFSESPSPALKIAEDEKPYLYQKSNIIDPHTEENQRRNSKPRAS